MPAQPDTRITRLLEWCENTQVPVISEAPEGATVIELGEDFEARVAAALASGDGPLAVRIPPAGAITVDPHPPAGPWVAVVASPGREWAARLLAARLEIPPAAPG